MKAYAFVEFDSYETAEDIVKQSVLVPYVLDGAVLTVGWAKGSDEISNGECYRVEFIEQESLIAIYFVH